MSNTEYYLLAHNDIIGHHLYFDAYPNLTGTYISFKNNLCPSHYNSSIRCFWEGDLEVVVRLNGKQITINDHDYKRGKFSVVDNYVIQGLGAVIEDNSEDETYLKFLIRQI